MKEIRIGDTVEQAIERADYPLDRVKQILAQHVVPAMLPASSGDVTEARPN